MEDEAALRLMVCSAAQQLWARGMLVGERGMLSAEVHRRRYVALPAKGRRSVLSEGMLLCVDVGGVDAYRPEIGLPEPLWRPHRLTYQSERGNPELWPASADLPVIRATGEAEPPMLLALLREAGSAPLTLAGLVTVPQVTREDEAGLRETIASSPLVGLDGRSVLATGPDLPGVLNLLEEAEHAATIEVTRRRYRT
jgi:hypothetical protein